MPRVPVVGDRVEVLCGPIGRWVTAHVDGVDEPTDDPRRGFDWSAGQAVGGRLLSDHGRLWRWPSAAPASAPVEVKEGAGEVPAAPMTEVCEHGDHAAPEGSRFCSDACLRCETESAGEEGCDGICGRCALGCGALMHEGECGEPLEVKEGAGEVVEVSMPEALREPAGTVRLATADDVLPPGMFSFDNVARVPSPASRPGAPFVVCSSLAEGYAADHPADETCKVCRPFMEPIGSCVHCKEIVLGVDGAGPGAVAHKACVAAAALPPHPRDEIRKCRVKVPGETSSGVAREEECGAIIGDGVFCTVCGVDEAPEGRAPAGRCSEHCKSVDHYGGELIVDEVVAPAAEVRTEYRLRLVRIVSKVAPTVERYVGHVARLGAHGEPLEIIKVHDSADSDVVVKTLHAVISAAAEAAPAKEREPYVAPTVRGLTAIAREAFNGTSGAQRTAGPAQAAPRVPFARSADRGDETCSEADGFDPDAWEGITPDVVARALAIPLPRRTLAENDRARRLADVCKVHLLNAEAPWRDLERMAETGELAAAGASVAIGDAQAHAIVRARALRDAELCALFQAIGGVR